MIADIIDKIILKPLKWKIKGNQLIIGTERDRTVEYGRGKPTTHIILKPKKGK